MQYPKRNENFLREFLSFRGSNVTLNLIYVILLSNPQTTNLRIWLPLETLFINSVFLLCIVVVRSVDKLPVIIFVMNCNLWLIKN